jgi:uncharacterized protein YceK
MTIMKKHLIAIIVVAGSGCASTMYWVQPGKSSQQTNTDLHACRTSVQPMGGNQVFSAIDLERSCMGSKGYVLSKNPAPY